MPPECLDSSRVVPVDSRFLSWASMLLIQTTPALAPPERKHFSAFRFINVLMRNIGGKLFHRVRMAWKECLLNSASHPSVAEMRGKHLSDPLDRLDFMNTETIGSSRRS